jgi:hypothetical protein
MYLNLLQKVAQAQVKPPQEHHVAVVTFQQSFMVTANRK